MTHNQQLAAARHLWSQMRTPARFVGIKTPPARHSQNTLPRFIGAMTQAPLSYLARARWMARRAIGYTLLPIRRWAHDLQFESETYRGITLRVHFLAPEGTVKNIQQALDLISETDPRSLGYIKTYLTGGFATGDSKQAYGWYVNSTKTCHLSHDALAYFAKHFLATLILHELCHARLHAMGFAHTAERRVRIEHICMRREIAFLRKLMAAHPEAPKLVDKIQSAIDLTESEIASLDPADYTNAALLRRYRQGVIDRLRLLKQLSVPYWLRRLVVLRTLRRVRTYRAEALLEYGRETTRHVADPASASRNGT